MPFILVSWNPTHALVKGWTPHYLNIIILDLLFLKRGLILFVILELLLI